MKKPAVATGNGRLKTILAQIKPLGSEEDVDNYLPKTMLPDGLAVQDVGFGIHLVKDDVNEVWSQAPVLSDFCPKAANDSNASNTNDCEDTGNKTVGKINRDMLMKRWTDPVIVLNMKVGMPHVRADTSGCPDLQWLQAHSTTPN